MQTVPGVQTLPGVGPARARLLQCLGIHSLEHLWRHLPQRYEDYSRITPITQLVEHTPATVEGLVSGISSRPARSDPRLRIIAVKLVDDQGSTLVLYWFFRSARGRRSRAVSPPGPVRKGTRIRVSGIPARDETKAGSGWQMTDPQVEPADSARVHTGRVIPVYPLTAGLSQRMLRQLVHNALESPIPLGMEILPETILRRYQLRPRDWSWRQIHFPDDPNNLALARRRLTFEEFFLLQLGLLLRRERSRADKQAVCCASGSPAVQRLLAALPFRPTAGQARVVAEIGKDMTQSVPMRRLLLGDVGSGKTVVIATALARTVEAGAQGLVLAPTELLAEQHGAKLLEWLGSEDMSVAMLTGRLPASERKHIRAAVHRGEVDVVVGTHALLDGELAVPRLGLAVVDEEHRFGVSQREALGRGGNTHLLVTTATPIPRTAALCIYGDLDVSIMKDLPPGRRPVDTRWILPEKRDLVYRFVRKEVEAGGQAFVVCPRIGAVADETSGNSGRSPASQSSALGAAEHAEILRNGLLHGLGVGLMHGRMSPADQRAVMNAFRAGELQVLVATSVVEVGVDVPSATVMVVEDAQHFGLAQLHQLRGRVGRGTRPGHCLLIAAADAPTTQARMQALRRSGDGFALAETDLHLRGPGDALGTRQWGAAPILMGDPLRDADLLQAARVAAQQVMEQDPSLDDPDHGLLRETLLQRIGRALGLQGEAAP